MRILIVEDEVLVALDLAQIIEEHGDVVIDVAHSLPKGEQLCAQHSYDVGFLDWTLGRGQTSAPIAEHLAQVGTQIVLTSGQRVEPDRLLRLGARHIAKPYAPRQILSTLTELAA